jgi:hypothetical protein
MRTRRCTRPLSFYKVIEGVAKFHTNRVRAAKKRGAAEPADPLTRQLPADTKDDGLGT